MRNRIFPCCGFERYFSTLASFLVRITRPHLFLFVYCDQKLDAEKVMDGTIILYCTVFRKVCESMKKDHYQSN